MRSSISIVAVLACLLVGCVSGGHRGSDEAPPSGSIYRSPQGNFTCTVPNLLRPGARQVEHVGDGMANVTFSDDMGAMLRIESIKLPDTLTITPENLPKQLDRCYDATVMDLFRSVAADTVTLHREQLTTAAGQTLFAVVQIPHGSTLANADTGQRPDSVRGVMVFVQQGYFYLLMNQEWPAGVPNNSPMPMRIERLQNDLQQAVAGMTFH